MFLQNEHGCYSTDEPLNFSLLQWPNVGQPHYPKTCSFSYPSHPVQNHVLWRQNREPCLYPIIKNVKKTHTKKTKICTIIWIYRGSYHGEHLAPFVAMLVNKELWNHPRCWSVPSRYTSAGKVRPSRFPNTPAQEEPDIQMRKKWWKRSFLVLCTI